MNHIKLKDLLFESLESDYPSNWDSGFAPQNSDSNLKLLGGEKPFQIGGRWYLYVWDRTAKDYVVYDYSSDMPIPYNDFQDMVQSVAIPASNVNEGQTI